MPEMKIRTAPCVPTNFVRDITNVNDKEMGGNKLCFKWSTCAEDDTVTFKLW
jgi:hypothetical protein